MSERSDPGNGLGRSSAGTPGFSEPSPVPPPAPVSPPVPAGPARPVLGRPPRWPAILSAAAVVLVVAVTVVATWVAWYADTHVTAPSTRSRPASPSSVPGTDADSIEFTSARGTGRLVVHDRVWETGRPDRLRISVELSCTTGTVDHGPSSFQLFDADGTLVPPSPVGAGPGELGYGSLGAGERVRGDVVFEVSRQVVTLVMSDDDGSVTALRIAD